MYEESATIWLEFFKRNKPKLSEFIGLLQSNDKYFLNHNYKLDFDDENYEYFLPYGFLQVDFDNVIDKNDEDNYYKTRIAIAIFNDVNFKKYIEKFGKKKLTEVCEKVFIYGRYDKFEIKPEQLLTKMINLSLLPKESLFDLSFLRGVESIKFSESFDL